MWNKIRVIQGDCRNISGGRRQPSSSSPRHLEKPEQTTFQNLNTAISMGRTHTADPLRGPACRGLALMCANIWFRVAYVAAHTAHRKSPFSVTEAAFVLLGAVGAAGFDLSCQSV